MENRDQQNPSTQPTDETQSTQTGEFKQPQAGSDQDLGTAGETTTLGTQQTDIEGTEPTDGSVIGAQGQQDTSSELVEGQTDKDGQSPLDGE